MATTMMRWGTFNFSVDTAAYDSLRLGAEYRWPLQERIGRDPALQYVGPGLRTLELRGTIYPHYRGGLDQIESLRATAAAGEPQLLVDGRGRIQGQWVATSIQETQRVFLPGGIPRKLEFSMTLQRYGEDT